MVFAQQGKEVPGQTLLTPSVQPQGRSPASKKLYKAVEESIKVLAERHKLSEYDEAEKDGRWRSYLLVRAARKLATDLKKKEIGDAWARAFNIHVWGFHEGKLDAEDIKPDVPYVEWLVNFVKETGEDA
jgi:hypothetical protein